MSRNYLAVAAVAAIVVASQASVGQARTTSSDPRVCRSDATGSKLSARECAYRAAFNYFRVYMQKRFHSQYPYQGALTCKTAGDILRYRCDFKDAAEYGTAMVRLGEKPTWTRSVSFTRFVCLVQRAGCP